MASDYEKRGPLHHDERQRVFQAHDEPKVYAAPGYVLFIRAMWNGRWQDVPVDPDAVDDLIETLRAAQEYAVSHRAKAALPTPQQ